MMQTIARTGGVDADVHMPGSDVLHTSLEAASCGRRFWSFLLWCFRSLSRTHYADALYMIVSGEVELSEIELKLKPGDLFGEIELFSVERRRTQSALARSDLELLWMSGAELKKLCERNPGLSLYFLRLMASRLTANASRFERRSPPEQDLDLTSCFHFTIVQNMNKLATR